jgi:hypothetical protein
LAVAVLCSNLAVMGLDNKVSGGCEGAGRRGSSEGATASERPGGGNERSNRLREGERARTGAIAGDEGWGGAPCHERCTRTAASPRDRVR